ncbi:MAG TPA: 23S rRNA (uracil(1939)-C(5))-methyltransferase RlmD [Candidatus Peregrinibacteria bacterium]|nr:23S rRNA (uracil(1939)-C(5))-methyltransferase RlmD [Candidatus Peregrinibacteria bacterium]
MSKTQTKPKIPKNPENIHRVNFEKLVFGGKALGRFETGACVFAPKVLPQEEAEVYISKKKRDYAEAMPLRILKKSPERVEPLCSHFEKCGGCSFQNLPYEKQLYWKEEFLRESLERIGKFSVSTIKRFLKPIIPARNTFRYRNKTEFSFTRGEEDRKIQVGFHQLGRKFDLVEPNFCLLQSEIADKALGALREILQKSKLTIFSSSPQNRKASWKGFLKNITFRTNYQEKILIIISTSDEKFPEKELEIWKSTFQKHLQGNFVGIIQLREKQKKKNPTKTKVKILYGQAVIPEKIADLLFEVGPQGFLQVNREMATVIIEKLRQIAAGFEKKPKVLDLFCGNGFLGLAVAKEVSSVTGIELNSNAIEEGRRNLILNSIKNYTFYEGDAAKTLKDLIQDNKFDLAVIDPPRAGLGEKACEVLLQTKTKKIIYISCNPSTLARDLKYLAENSYQIISSQALDMFPQTYHLESITVLEKIAKKI